MLSRKVLSACLGVVVALAPAMAFGQRTTGVINGTVSDSTGALVVGVAVTLTNQDTGIVSRAMTNATGAFVFLNVDPGPYALTFAKPGFRTISIQPFALTVNQTLTENQTMTVGATSETVEVDASQLGIMLQKGTSELGTVIQTKEIQQLPLNGRNFTSLLVLSPGVKIGRAHV